MKLLRIAAAIMTGELGRLQQLTNVQEELIKHYQQREVDLIERAEKAEAADPCSECDDYNRLEQKVIGLRQELSDAENALKKAGYSWESGAWTPPAPQTACNHRFEAVERIGSSGLVETVVECVSCGQAGDPLEQAVAVAPDVLSDDEAYILKAALNRHQETGSLEAQNCYDAIIGSQTHDTLDDLGRRGYMQFDRKYKQGLDDWVRYRLTEKGAAAVGGTLIYWEGK